MTEPSGGTQEVVAVGDRVTRTRRWRESWSKRERLSWMRGLLTVISLNGWCDVVGHRGLYTSSSTSYVGYAAKRRALEAVLLSPKCVVGH